MSRGQNYGRVTKETLFAVYEAKKQAEKVKSVGEATYLLVLYADGSWKEIKRDRHPDLDKLVTKYGPRIVITDDLPSEDSFYPAEKESSTQTG
jgi:hypothetical protein